MAAGYLGAADSNGRMVKMTVPVNTIICGDCLEVMRGWPDGCVDLVLADPPFNVGKNFGEKTNDNMQEEDYWNWLKVRLLEVVRVMAERSRFYVFHSDKGVYLLKPLLDSMGLKYVQTLIWFGPNLVGGAGKITNDWHYMHEPCLLYRKGKRVPMLNSLVPTLFSVQVEVRPQRNFRQGRYHITQKPTNLMLTYITRTPGDLILDPFCGSGTTCVAAKMLGRRYIGIDISPEYCKIARQRLEAVETGVPVTEQNAGQMALFGAER